ncbi:MAG: hypothetical protein LLG04_09675 [Parachlamydia sp.]|nr:hypothetical protein [Parachlamydia sp.]
MTSSTTSFLTSTYQKVPLSQRPFVYRELAQDPNPKSEYKKAVGNMPSFDPDRFYRESSEVLKAANQKRDELMLGCKVTEAVFTGVDLLLDVGIGTAAVSSLGGVNTVGVGATLAVQGTQWFIDQQGKYLVEQCEKSADERFVKVLGKGLQAIDPQTWQGLPNNQARKEAILAQIFTKRGNNLLLSADEKARPLLLFHMNRLLEEKVEHLDELRSRELGNVAEDVDALKQFSSNMQQLYNDVQAEMQTSTTKLAEQLRNINTGLKEIRDQVASIGSEAAKDRKMLVQQGRDLSFVKSYLYSKMTPEEKLHALRAGMSGLPAAEQEKEEKKMGLIKQQQDFISTSNKVLGGANVVLNVLRGGLGKKLGISEKTISTFDTAVKVGETAVNVFASVTTGNWIGAASAVIGLFGSKKRDVAGERHQAIMQGLENIQATLSQNHQELITHFDEVHKQQVEILKNQQIIWNGIVEVIRTQQAIYKEIIDLGESVAKNHQEIMRKLEEIHEDVRYGNFLQKIELSKEADRAFRFLDSRFAEGQFQSWGQMVAHFRDRRDDFIHALAGLRDLFDRDVVEPLHPVLCLKGYPTRNDIVEDEAHPHFWLRTKVFKANLDLFASLYPTKGIKWLTSLMLPSKTISHLRSKWNGREQLPTQVEGLSLIQSHLFDSANLLDILRVYRYGRFLFEIQKYFPFRQGDDIYSTALDFINTLQDHDLTIQRDLQCLNRVLSLVVAQQTLLAGDFLIPHLAEILIGKISGNPEVKESFEAILSQMCDHANSRLWNRVLERNLIKWIVSSHLNNNHWGYTFAYYMTEDSAYLNQLFPDWTFKWYDQESKGKDRGWYLQISTTHHGSLYLAMPEPDALRSDTLEYPDYLDAIIDLKRNVCEGILDSQIETVLPKENHALVRQIQMQHTLLKV